MPLQGPHTFPAQTFSTSDIVRFAFVILSASRICALSLLGSTLTHLVCFWSYEISLETKLIRETLRTLAGVSPLINHTLKTKIMLLMPHYRDPTSCLPEPRCSRSSGNDFSGVQMGTGPVTGSEHVS